MPSTDKNKAKKRDLEKEARLRSTIRSRIREIGISAREASRRAGFNVGYVGDILEGRSSGPEANRILRLAETLDFDAADFISDSEEVEPTPTRHASAYPELRRPSSESVATIPLYASPLPISATFVSLSAKPVGECQALPIMAKEPAGYAVTVPNNLNAPRYYVGETLYVKPGVTPKEGDFVIVRLKADHKVAIGRLGSVCAESLILRFVALEGAESEVSIPLADVESVHWIMAVLH